MRKTVEHQKRELIDNLLAARRSLIDAVQAFPPGRIGEPFLGSWSILDLLAHLVGWDATNLQAMEEIIAGRYPTFFQYYDKDWQSYNRQLVQTYRKPSLDEILADVRASHQRLIALLDALPPESVVKGKARSVKGRTVTLANLLRAEAADEQEHAAQVNACLSPAQAAS